MPQFDPAKIAADLLWLQQHPAYEEKPATIEEFLGSEYLNFPTARDGLVEALVDIFGKEVNSERISQYEKAMFTGAIGIGKTTFASIAIPYMVHVTLCLKDPQGFYGLAAGSRIAFMQMSTSAKQAKEVIFGDLKARVQYSKWFTDNYPYDPDFTNQMRFAKDIWVLPGGSNETGFEGYNILGGILDEMDSHKITDNKDYADIGYDTIENRIQSRFQDFTDMESESHLGLLICIGQMKKSNGFAARKYKQFLGDKKAYVKRQTIWESFGWAKWTRSNGTRASFWFNIKSKKEIPSTVAEHLKSEDIIEIPVAYRARFDNNPEKALKDLAGIPPATSDPFISQVDRIEECVTRWVEKHNNSTSPVKPNPTRVEFEDWFEAVNDPRKRVGHIDFAVSANGDALGLAIGHVESVMEFNVPGHKRIELKPYIVIDCLIRLKAMSGMQIDFSEVRSLIYDLKWDRGFNIKLVSMDGFQSTDTKQQLRKKKFDVVDLSADKSTLPYEDLREAIYERRLDFPPYMTFLNKGDTDLVEITVKEIMELSYDGKKVDHLPEGSKDVADALACVVSTLMGDRTFSRGVRSITAPPTQGESSEDINESYGDAWGTAGMIGANVLAFPRMDQGMQAPIPGAGMGLTLPTRLRPK